MRKVFRILTVVAVAVGLTSAVFAAPEITTWQHTKRSEGDVYKRQTNPADQRPVNMPRSTRYEDQGPTSAFSGTTSQGPVSMSTGSVVRTGSALVAPAGGRIYGPKQQAEREITRLIRVMR